MNVGITGHQSLNDQTAWRWVRQAVRDALTGYSPPVVGVTCLAAGADQLFAETVLALGGQLHAVIPFAGYETLFGSFDARVSYDRLLAKSQEVEVLRRRKTVEGSYLAAGQRVVDLSDVMVAVWDGHPAGGLGGTGDIVQYAMKKERTIVHINPAIRAVSQL